MEGPSSSVDLSEVSQLLRKAEQAMKPPGFLGQLFGKEADYDLAVQLLQQCAQCRRQPSIRSICIFNFSSFYFFFRLLLRNTNLRASSQRRLLVTCEPLRRREKEETRTQAQATMYVEAGNCVRRYSLTESVPVFAKGVSVLLATGRLAAAAKVHRQLAEEFEAAGDRETAAGEYLKAAELFETDEFSKTQYSHCICKHAELLAWGGGGEGGGRSAAAAADTLEAAARIFEAEAYKASQNNLLQYGAKELFLKALLLRLAIPRQDPAEYIDLQLALGRYGERNPHFSGTREAQLVKQLVAAAEERDSDAFAAAVEAFDSITRLDPWKVHFLLKAKALLEPDGNAGSQAPVRLGSDGEVDLS
ncbi:hypothetical protein Efla_001977 [Eimeria flavescens]